MTVSVTEQTHTGFDVNSYLAVLVVTGANTSQPVASLGGNRRAAGTISASYSSQYADSWGWLIYSDFNGAASPTAGADQTRYDTMRIGGGVANTYSITQQNSTTPVVGTTVTMSTTAPNSGNLVSYVYFEMEPEAPPAPAPTTIQNAVINNAVVR